MELTDNYLFVISLFSILWAWSTFLFIAVCAAYLIIKVFVDFVKSIFGGTNILDSSKDIYD